MRILSYEAGGGGQDNLHFAKITFGRLNLIVGDSATGKTRLLNTIFNGAKLVTRKDQFYIGAWDMTFEHEGNTYRWRIETSENEEEGGEGEVASESIVILESGSERTIVSRDADSFVFDGRELPRLSARESSISILQDEDLVRPLYKGLSAIMRRNFSGSDLEMEAAFQAVPQKLLRKVGRTRDLDSLFSEGLNLSGKLYVLSHYFAETYERIRDQFLAVFPFVSQVELRDAEDFGLHHPGLVPVFCLKERDVNTWVPLQEFSSGMRKVLLILTDVFTLPSSGGVYLIDEYENSLGINAINFFPSVLLEVDSPSQFIVTSHHPYIIGNVPVKDWIVLHRKGAEVLVKQGPELEERFGKSKQEAFLQLINDPFYAEGVE